MSKAEYDKKEKETEYSDKIDACFPYDDEGAWKAAIDEGMTISDDGAYIALREICGAPSEVPRTDLAKMLDYWASRYDHRTKPTMMIAAKAVIRREYLSEEDVLKYLDEIASYPRFYAAAGILWWAAPRDRGWPGRATDSVEEKFTELMDRWRKLNNGK